MPALCSRCRWSENADANTFTYGRAANEQTLVERNGESYRRASVQLQARGRMARHSRLYIAGRPANYAEYVAVGAAPACAQRRRGLELGAYRSGGEWLLRQSRRSN